MNKSDKNMHFRVKRGWGCQTVVARQLGWAILGGCLPRLEVDPELTEFESIAPKACTTELHHGGRREKPVFD